MPQTQQSVVGNEALQRVLKELEEVVVTFEETADPNDQEAIDEYERLLSVLYQKLADAQSVTAQAIAAATLANQKAAAANSAAEAANDAATFADQKAEFANTKAGYAKTQGDYAKQQGDYAKEQIDGAKGDFESLDARLDWIQENAGTVDYEENNDSMSLLDDDSSDSSDSK